MSPSQDLLIATFQKNGDVLSAFEAHASCSRVETATQCLTLLRKTYPDYHITEVSESHVSLFEYAETGKATLTLDTDTDSFNATRKWKSVGERIEKKLHPGRLEDEYRLCRFKYEMEGEQFLVYYFVWKDMLEARQQNFYILYPRSSADVQDGHCKQTDELVLKVGKWTSQLHEEIFVFDDGDWDKSKELYKSVHGSSWEDVILDPAMKQNLIEDVQGFFDNQTLYGQFSVPWKRGIILHGVPGNGKTVSIKALMSSLYDREDSIPSLYVKSFNTKCQTEQTSVRQIFMQARKSAPCLLVFEDLDSLVGDDIRSYFLNEVDGLESNDGILMIGSTNHLDRLDPAIAKRPSRFDRKYHFKLPGEAERTLYAEYWRKKLLKNGTVDFPEELCQTIAQLTEGFSFAYLKELFVMALLSLVRGIKGDDYEIVDAVDGEKTDSESGDNEKSAPVTEEKKAAPDTCQCAKTCEKCKLPLETAATQFLNACEKKEEEVKASKRAMPKVNVPDHLQDNLLLKVVKQQIRTLHAEMDNTSQDQWLSGKKGMSGSSDGGPQAVFARAMRRAYRC
jgi:AAA+ superfamily predicted ATPase